MEHSWENWPLIHTEITGHDDEDRDFLHAVDDDFLRDILQQPELSSESETTQSFHPIPPLPLPLPPPPPPHRPASSSNSPRTFILSFDNSTIIPAAPEQPYLALGGPLTPSSKSKSSSSPALTSKKRALEINTENDQNLEPKPMTMRATSTQGGKKSRNDSQTVDHIMAERKRRQELTERFIALSATIPGLKKTDKASILGEAINYVKQLQERVTELEKRKRQRGGDQAIAMISSETSGDEEEDDDDDEEEEEEGEMAALPDVEARVVEKEVLIEIHCQKANGIELKLLEHLENLHLSVTGSSVLPFGNSTLGITIIAQMGEAYRMTVNDLATNLREVLSSHVTTTTTDPY